VYLFYHLQVYLYSLQASSHSLERDEEFAFELQQQEWALLNDSHVARNIQVIMKYI